MDTPCVNVDNVSKLFWLRRERPASVSGMFINLLRLRRRNARRAFLALRDVSFTARAGETVGIIGPNGSGKSTLLKLIAGIYRPSSGSIRTRGQMIALLELGAGFHGELSGRENVYLNGSLLGHTRAQITELMPEIVEFAGVQSFLDTPFKHYSSGMQVRLGFAVAMHLHADVMLLDEVFAVGDMLFQQKCIERLRDFQAQGRTLLLVSHSMPLIRDLCDRTLWLSRGKVMGDGETNDIVDAYTQYMGRLK